MTGQIPDEVRYAGTCYQLTAVEGTGLFDPADHGLAAQPLSSACWRGFHCVYTVDGDRFLLDTVTIGLAPEHFRNLLLGYRPVKARRGLHPVAPRYHLAVQMPFTGRMLLGDDYVRVTYLHMGFLPAWTFVRVVELAFDDGVLVAARDRSDEAAEIRDRAGEEIGRPRNGEPAEQWISRTFSLGFGYSLPTLDEDRGGSA